MNKKDGGPAFARPSWPGAVGGHQEGMALRDYFAAKAMQAATAGHISYYGHESNHWQVSDIASYAYELADAMLAARGAQ